MLTKEVFEYFQKINVVNEKPIPHELFLPIRHKLSFGAATNYSFGEFSHKDRQESLLILTEDIRRGKGTPKLNRSID